MDQMIERYESDPSKRKRKDKRPIWVFLGLMAIGIKIFANDPYLVEQIYSNTIFKFIRTIFDKTIGWFDFPFIYIVVPFMLFKIMGVYINGILMKGGCIIRLLNFLYSTIASFLWLVFWFTILWGINYNRVDTYERLDIQQLEHNDDEILTELDERSHILATLRESMLDSLASFKETDMTQGLEDIIREDVKKAMLSLNYQPDGHVRIRELAPKGILLRFGTAGFYFPFTGECNIDKGLHPLQKPFTMAHEMAHGYGVGNEATCNFIAYVACKNSSDPFIRYSGQLAFWRYLASSYKRRHPELYENYRAQLYPGIIRDLDDVNTNNDLYPDILPQLRENAYDTYLKSQGEMDGIESYGMVVEVVLDYEAQSPSHTLH